MPKPLVRSLWFASVVALGSGYAFGDDPPMLGQDDLKKPATVSAWLKENGDKADKARAKTMFAAGLQAKAEKRFGPAGKAFGESAIYYPTPEAIHEYADVQLHTLGEIRERNKDRGQHMKSDLSSALSLYQSVLASDTVLATMSAAEKQQTKQNVDCLAAYLRSEKASMPCPPLKAYGVSK